MGLAIGVDVGGTKIAAGLVDDTGAIVRASRLPTPEDPAALRAAIAQAVDECRSGEAIEAVGVAAAGFVAQDRSTVVFAPNLAWREEPLGAQLQQATGLPVVVENDASAAAWAEHRFGAGRGADLACVTVGTGVGGGLVVGGRLVRGRRGFAAEFGHIPLVPEGRLCGCGSRGCWEQYGSGSALVRAARERAQAEPAAAADLLGRGDGTPEGIEGDHVTAAARAGDPVALGCFAEIGRWTGRGLAALVAVLDPPLLILGGGVSEAGELLLAPARDALAELHPEAVISGPPQLRSAELGNDAGLVGAADLARR